MCIHNAYLSVPGGKKCLLCGAVIPDIAEMPATGTEQAANTPEEVKPDKSTGRKTTRKTGK
jgi:hypothetical protein